MWEQLEKLLFYEIFLLLNKQDMLKWGFGAFYGNLGFYYKVFLNLIRAFVFNLLLILQSFWLGNVFDFKIINFFFQIELERLL